jgi:hypothetical protein
MLMHLGEYHHTIMHSTPMQLLDGPLVWALQALGADVLQITDCYRIPEPRKYTAAILYDIPMAPPLPIPTILYAYHNTPVHAYTDVTIVPTEVMASQIPADVVVIPPAIRSRAMRGIRKNRKPQPYTLGLFSSGELGKYPSELVRWLMAHIPNDTRLIISQVDPTVRPRDSRKQVWQIPVMLEATLKGIQMSDVVIYAHSSDYTTPYGRLSAEMLAGGVPVICERRGAVTTRYEDRKHVLYFDDPEQILHHVETLRTNTVMAETLAANGQMLASWDDMTIHIGEIKRLLRMLGA